jgi:hypothetical protein
MTQDLYDNHQTGNRVQYSRNEYEDYQFNNEDNYQNNNEEGFQ